MPQPQFDAKLKSKDGKTMLFIRGPFAHPTGDPVSEISQMTYAVGFELRMVAVSEMGKWPRIWKGEEVEDDSTN